MIALRSVLFNIAFFGWSAIVCLSFCWTLLMPRPVLMWVVRWYMGSIGFLERWIMDLHYEVIDGHNLPSGPCIVAAKHQSAWETLKLQDLFRDPAIVMKRELERIPIWGTFARKGEMIFVDRGAPHRALVSLIREAKRVSAQGRPIIIFPQGTRIKPGVRAPYRAGVGAVYERLNLPLVPMAHNAGVFWPRDGFMKRPGTITVRFLPPIPPGLSRTEVMARLERDLEAESDRLVVAAGGPALPPPGAPDEPTTAADAGGFL